MKLNNLVLHIRNIFFVFSHCDGWLREFGLCVPHIYNPVEQKVMAGQFHAPSHPGVLKKKICMGKYFRYILLIRICRGANNCGQHSLEKNIYFIMRFSPHFQLIYFNDRLEFCECFEWKIKRINNADLFSQLPLLIFIKGANISGGHCTQKKIQFIFSKILNLTRTLNFISIYSIYLNFVYEWHKYNTVWYTSQICNTWTYKKDFAE